MGHMRAWQGDGSATSLHLDGLDALVRPRSIAIFGASSDPNKIGGRPIRFLRDSGFAGDVYPINPRHDSVQGLPAYASLSAVPGPVDLALIGLPRDDVMKAVQECADAGVKLATIFSATFAETGAEGARLQDEIRSYAAARGMRLLGPNCIGSRNRATGAVGTFAAVEGEPVPELHTGKVAFVSQSGATAVDCVLNGHRRGLDFDPWISTGNECDVEFADALAMMALDDDVQVIAGYLEGCRDGAKLSEALALAQGRGKPVVLLKVGRSAVGAQAAKSHTGSLVGSDEAFDALFRQYGVCRVDSIAELLEVSYAFAWSRRPRGRRVGVLTGSGGAGILMADVAEETGLELPPLSEKAQGQLKSLWPAAGVGNPVDMTAQVMNDKRLLTEFLTTVADDGSSDVIVTFLSYMGALEPWASEILAALRAVVSERPGITLAVVMTALPEIVREVEKLGVAVFADPTAALSALARVVDTCAALDKPAPQAIAVRPAVLPGSGPVNETEAKRVLSAAGIPVVEDRRVASAAEAAEAAAGIGFPVAMKVLSADVTHKTEAGGVRLGIETADAAAKAYEGIVADVARHAPEARIEGVIVSPQISGGVEMILGVKNDPTFGPIVMAGLGGVLVEVLKDFTYRRAPFGPETAREMVRELHGYPLLTGVRGFPPGDVDALCQALSDLSLFAAAHADSIDSVDINPFVVQPRGQGAIALDALITRRDPAEKEQV